MQNFEGKRYDSHQPKLQWDSGIREILLDRTCPLTEAVSRILPLYVNPEGRALMLARDIRKMIKLLKFESGLVADQDLVMDPPYREPEKELFSELGPMAFSFLREW